MKGRDWNTFDEISWKVRRAGNLSDPLNYDASEQIAAGYVSAKYVANRFELTAGVRVEHTLQGYYLKFATAGARNEGEQNYTDVLPDFHAKYELHRDGNLHLSYYRALNRPSFFEIVPYNVINEDYKERGNPDLKHTVADNLDLRYEYFPSASEQFMVGVFYKHIKDPIEYGFDTSGQDLYFTPNNYGTAQNFGVEVDVAKYFRNFGIKSELYVYAFIYHDNENAGSGKSQQAGSHYDAGYRSDAPAVGAGRACGQFVVALSRHAPWMGRPDRLQLYGKTVERSVEILQRRYLGGWLLPT